MIQNGTLQKGILSISILFFLAGCGQADVKSVGLTVEVLPNQSYLLPGNASGCLDYQALKAGLVTSTTATLGTSVSGPLRISFPRFRLTWSNTTSLNIAYLTLTIKSPNFSGGVFTYNVAGNELSALLSKASNTFIQSEMFNSTDLAVSSTSVGTIYSNDDARDCQSSGKHAITGLACTYFASIFNKDYAACGLNIGGISLTNSKVGGFTAPFVLRLVGYSMDSKYNQTPLQTQVTGSVVYSGIQ